MGHTHMCITDTQTFLGKLVVGSTTLRSTNRPRRAYTRRSNTYRQHWCHGNRSKIDKRGGRYKDLSELVFWLGGVWQVSSRSTDSVDCCCQNYLAADQLCQPTRSTVHHPHQQAETTTNSSRTQQTLEWTASYKGTERSQLIAIVHVQYNILTHPGSHHNCSCITSSRTMSHFAIIKYNSPTPCLTT